MGCGGAARMSRDEAGARLQLGACTQLPSRQQAAMAELAEWRSSKSMRRQQAGCRPWLTSPLPRAAWSLGLTSDPSNWGHC